MHFFLVSRVLHIFAYNRLISQTSRQGDCSRELVSASLRNLACLRTPCIQYDAIVQDVVYTDDTQCCKGDVA